MITVAEYNSIDQLTPFHKLWERVRDDSPVQCLSQSWDWLSANESRGKLRVLMAILRGRPFGLWPLLVENRSTRWGRLRVLTEIGAPFAPFTGPLGRNTAAMLAASLRYLKTTRRDWDLVDFQFADPDDSRRRRLVNALKLVGWSLLDEAETDWWEISPTSISIGRASSKKLVRVRGDDWHPAPLSILEDGLSVIEDCLGLAAAKPLREMHHAGLREGITDWCLLEEAGNVQAVALNLKRQEKWICTALVGRSESVRRQLFEDMLVDSHFRGDEAFLFRAGQIPNSPLASTASSVGFRYTHLSPWAIKARWRRFCQSFGAPNPQAPKAATIPQKPHEKHAAPSPPRLKIYQPSSQESLPA